MLKFFKTPLGITIIIVIIIAIVLIAMNWSTVKGWFITTATNSGRQMCIQLGGDQCQYQGLVVPCATCSSHGVPIK